MLSFLSLDVIDHEIVTYLPLDVLYNLTSQEKYLNIFWERVAQNLEFAVEVIASKQNEELFIELIKRHHLDISKCYNILWKVSATSVSWFYRLFGDNDALISSPNKDVDVLIDFLNSEVVHTLPAEYIRLLFRSVQGDNINRTQTFIVGCLKYGGNLGDLVGTYICDMDSRSLHEFFFECIRRNVPIPSWTIDGLSIDDIIQILDMENMPKYFLESLLQHCLFTNTPGEEEYVEVLSKIKTRCETVVDMPRPKIIETSQFIRSKYRFEDIA